MTARVTFYTSKRRVAALCSINISLNWIGVQIHCGGFGPFSSPKLLTQKENGRSCRVAVKYNCNCLNICRGLPFMSDFSWKHKDQERTCRIQNQAVKPASCFSGGVNICSFCPISTDLKHLQLRLMQTLHPGHHLRNEEKSVEHLESAHVI